MSRAGLYFGRFAHVFIGYVAAVLTAVFVTLIAMFSAAALTGPENSLAGALGEIGSTVLAGIMVTFPTALPGFLVALAVSLALRWRGWLSFTLAGGLDAILALTFSNGVAGLPLAMLNSGLTLSCIAGGLAGGFVYWLVAGRFTAGWRKATA